MWYATAHNTILQKCQFCAIRLPALSSTFDKEKKGCIDWRRKSRTGYRDSRGVWSFLLNKNLKLVIASQISPLPQAVLRHVKKYIEENLHNNLSLDELARETNYSRGHFLRMFRAATGRPPHRYLMERRIERAKSMLLEAEGISFIDIAARCGFSSQSHLTRAFRKQIGVTPSAFKRRSELKDLV